MIYVLIVKFSDNVMTIFFQKWLDKVTDIAAVAKMARDINDVRVGDKDGGKVLLAVDNTFCSPYFQNPLELGADLVVHSVTKYINGHSDVVMGVVCTNDSFLYEQLCFIQNSMGAVPSPFDCYLAHRGLKTLHLRMEASSRWVPLSFEKYCHDLQRFLT